MPATSTTAPAAGAAPGGERLSGRAGAAILNKRRPTCFSNPGRDMSEPQATYLEAALEGGALVLTVTRPQIEGEEVAQGLARELREAVERTGASNAVVDLSRTRYVSSIAFWPLLALRRQLQAAGGRLLICGLSGVVEEVFTTTKMVSGPGTVSAPFEVAPDRAAALARLGGGAP
jgi:anti-anti-sigma factor